MKKGLNTLVLLVCALGLCGSIVNQRADGREASAEPFNFEEASRNVPKPKELYPIVSRDMGPMNLKIDSDEIVDSDTDPSMKLRKVTGRFESLKLEGKTWVSKFVILMPADNTINQTPMTIEMIPNYRHYDFDERHYIDFMMWVAHVFDDRPITQISDLSFERRAGRNTFRAKVQGKAKLRMVRVVGSDQAEESIAPKNNRGNDTQFLRRR